MAKNSKTVKKLDNNVIKALTLACEHAKENIEGFSWLTHTAKYDNFPASLLVTCIFDTDAQLDNAIEQQQDQQLQQAIHKQLLNVGIVIKATQKHVFFDTEQRCNAQHQGNWAVRLKQN